MSEELELMRRRCERERRARKEAESLLEAKTREVYQANEELHSLAARMRREADQSRAIVDTAAEGILTIDDRGRIQSFNPAAERIFRSAAAEVVGRPVWSLIPSPSGEPEPADEGGAPGFLARNFGPRDGAVTTSCEAVGIRSDGDRIPLELAVGVVESQEGRSYCALVRDISARRRLESQLAQAQKLESVGQLAAGVAHEINTPVQYVGDNARFLAEAFADLDELIGLYQRLLGHCRDGSCPADLLPTIESKIEEMDLDFLREEAPQAIRQSIEGAERVASIVRAMKEFSHPGSQEKQAVDLNHAIENTITVSRNEWKYVAEVETRLDRTLPLVTCLPGEINQVVLNLIVNAAHAIQDVQGKRLDRESSAERGKITISTARSGDHVEIRVSDTGTGIPAHARSRVFDPFFTTKAVGQGTGQGLAIAYAVVVEKHGGTIGFETAEGRGTTFVVRLPLTSEPALTGTRHGDEHPVC